MTAKINVLLISKANEQAFHFRESLSELPGYKVVFEETAEKALSVLTSGAVDCVIFNLERFGMPQLILVSDIRKVAKLAQILVFADATDEAATASLKDDRSLVVVDKSLINIQRDVGGLCDRLIKGGEPKFYREAVRRPANQVGSITLLETGRHFDMRVRDISEKGACLEVNTRLAKSGDKVKLVIHFEKLNRERTILAEIRWAKPHGPRTVVGVRFLKSDN